MTYNLAFYTYFYGSDTNDAYIIPPLPTENYPCYFFTNNKNLNTILKNTKWINIFDDKPTNDDLIESNMIGKHIKTMPHLYENLNTFDYLCYLDTKLPQINVNFVYNMINSFFLKNNYALLLREHWFIKESVWNEYYESIKQHRYSLQSQQYQDYIKKQIQKGLSETTIHHAACGFLIRNMKHPKIKEINKIWYENILECGIQDQISFFFVKQLFEKDIYIFTEYPYY